MKAVIPFLLLTISVAFSTPVGAQEATNGPEQKEFTIENCVNEFSPEQAEATNNGYRYWFADKDFTDGRTIKLSVVKPNLALHPPHSHPEDEFFFVLEGKAQFYLNGKTKVVGAYSSLYCPSNSEHGISNAGDTELKYLVIKRK